MPETGDAKVDTPCAAYLDMSQLWPLIDDLRGGSGPMRDRCAVYLPQFEKETPTHYNARVAGSILFSAYGDTAKNMTGKPFSKAVTIQGDLPEPLESISDDVYGQGKGLTQLSRDLFGDFINRGLGHILVDYPLTTNEEGDTPNLQQERDAGFRPRLIQISPDQLIAWRIEKDSSGTPELTSIRIHESHSEPDGLWGEKQVEYVRVIEKETWQLFRKEEGDEEFKLDNQGVNSLGRVPLVTGYANQTGFLTADPPLKELAERNLAHYKSDSDQRSILHMARTVTLCALGFSAEEAEKIALGPHQIISSQNVNASVSFLEHQGQAIEAGRKDLDSLKEEMVVLGLQPFAQKTGNQTATGQGIDEDRSNSDMQAWVMSLERLLYQAYVMAAEWVKAELPADFKADVDNDFSIWVRAMEDIAHLIKMRQAQELSRTTFLREIKRRGILSERVDVDEEIEAIEAEGPSLGTVGVGDGDLEAD